MICIPNLNNSIKNNNDHIIQDEYNEEYTEFIHKSILVNDIKSYITKCHVIPNNKDKQLKHKGNINIIIKDVTSLECVSYKEDEKNHTTSSTENDQEEELEIINNDAFSNKNIFSPKRENISFIVSDLSSLRSQDTYKKKSNIPTITLIHKIKEHDTNITESNTSHLDNESLSIFTLQSSYKSYNPSSHDKYQIHKKDINIKGMQIEFPGIIHVNSSMDLEEQTDEYIESLSLSYNDIEYDNEEGNVDKDVDNSLHSSSTSSSILLNALNEDYEGNPDPIILRRLLHDNVKPIGLDPLKEHELKRQYLLKKIKDCDESSQGSCQLLLGRYCGGINYFENDSDDEEDVNMFGSENSILLNDSNKNKYLNQTNEHHLLDETGSRQSEEDNSGPKISKYALIPDKHYEQYKYSNVQQEMVLLLPKQKVKNKRRKFGNPYLPVERVIKIDENDNTYEYKNKNKKVGYYETDIEFTLQKYNSTPNRIAELVLKGKTYEKANNVNGKKNEKVSDRKRKIDYSIMGRRMGSLKERRIPYDDDLIDADRSVKSCISDKEDENDDNENYSMINNVNEIINSNNIQIKENLILVTQSIQSILLEKRSLFQIHNNVITSNKDSMENKDILFEIVLKERIENKKKNPFYHCSAMESNHIQKVENLNYLKNNGVKNDSDLVEIITNEECDSMMNESIVSRATLKCQEKNHHIHKIVCVSLDDSDEVKVDKNILETNMNIKNSSIVRNIVSPNLYDSDDLQDDNFFLETSLNMKNSSIVRNIVSPSLDYSFELQDDKLLLEISSNEKDNLITNSTLQVSNCNDNSSTNNNDKSIVVRESKDSNNDTGVNNEADIFINEESWNNGLKLMNDKNISKGSCIVVKYGQTLHETEYHHDFNNDTLMCETLTLPPIKCIDTNYTISVIDILSASVTSHKCKDNFFENGETSYENKNNLELSKSGENSVKKLYKQQQDIIQEKSHYISTHETVFSENSFYIHEKTRKTKCNEESTTSSPSVKRLSLLEELALLKSQMSSSVVGLSFTKRNMSVTQ